MKKSEIPSVIEIMTEPQVQLLCETSGMEKIYRYDGAIVVKLPNGRNVLSAASLNGGYREECEAVFNHQPKPGTNLRCCCDLEGGSVETYMKITAQRLGLDPAAAVGMMTAANMQNACIVTKNFRDRKSVV